MKGRMQNGEGKRSLCIWFWRIYIRSVVLTESAVQIYLAQCQSLLPQRCYSRGITACHFIPSRVILSYFLIHQHAICLNHPCRWIHKQAILIKKIDTSLFLHASQRFAFTRGAVRLGCVLIDFPPEFAQSLLELVAAVSSVAQLDAMLKTLLLWLVSLSFACVLPEQYHCLLEVVRFLGESTDTKVAQREGQNPLSVASAFFLSDNALFT